MERLTVKWKPKLYDALDPIDIVDNEYSKINYEKLLTTLGEYEDAEEQGLLLRLPCKAGDTIYRFWYVSDTPYRIQEQTIKTLSQVVAMIEDGVFGKTVFLTKEEAEQALADMQGV